MRRKPIHEGVVAGLIGATSVAGWFLIVDSIAGHPLRTPILLGRALLSVLGPGSGDTAAIEAVAYTIFHYVVFAGLGIVAAVVFRWSERQPAVLAGALILFVAFELGFYGMTTLFAQRSELGAIAWYQIGIANLIAAFLMGGYLLRSYPRAVRTLRTVLEGGE